MNQNFKNLLLGTALCCGSLAAQAQGLEGIIVEEYHTVTQADADFINTDLGNSSFTIPVGAKVYRVFVDMAPGYKLNQVFGAPETSPGSGVSLNPLDFTTTTTFWNDDNFGADIPGQTRRIDEGTAFDSYITVNTTGTSGGTAGCGSATQQFGVLRTADTNGDLTTCGVYPGFPGNDGSIPGTGPALTYNISGLLDLTALTGAAASFQVINDAWTTLPASQGVDPSGTNRVLIGQFTTAGTFSFHINVQLSSPTSQLETYVWNQAGAGEVVSPFLTFPQALPPDCNGVPGGPALPGTACNDGNANTGNDTWSANCTCVGQLIDCLGVPGGSALPGTACNDGNANTGNDTWNANCTCVGQLIDCLGVPGGSALPGTACNDGNANTGNDTWDANCTCVGQLIDCLGVPGGSALPGTACNDGNANTGNDTWSANCTCVGQLIDCLGVPGGPAQPGTPCNDGQAQTGNDTWDANCNCVGQLIDCLGVPGGSALPGSACNDGNAATINDVYGANCVCAGTPIGNCTEILTLSITLDNNGAETTWEVRDQSGTTVIASGGPYQNGQAGAIVTETICLNQLCYRLVVNDAGGDGINGGGYVLTDANGRRVVDANGSFTSTSSVANEFCLPLSVARLINASCDRTNLTFSSSTQIYASFFPGASGYQFWIFDPHGSYTRRVFRTAQNLVPVNLVTNPVPADLDLNVRVRALVNGTYTAFGPACRFRLNTPGGGGREAILFDEASNVTMSLYPNPNRGEVVNVAFDGIVAAERMDIDVMDIFGKRVMAEQIAAPGGAFVHTMDLSYLAPGVYMVNVRVGERLYTQRLVRQ